MLSWKHGTNYASLYLEAGYVAHISVIIACTTALFSFFTSLCIF